MKKKDFLLNFLPCPEQMLGSHCIMHYFYTPAYKIKIVFLVSKTKNKDNSYFIPAERAAAAGGP
jgi:hypothetical protein